MKFKAFGCTVNFSFLFILVLCAFALLDCRALMYIMLFSSLHELGHLICLYACGGKARELNFSYFGFALKYDDLLDRKKETLVLSGGLIVNLILYIILRDEYNLILFILNILPVYPLDGGRILRLFFPEISVVVSRILIALIFSLSVILLIRYQSFSLLLISIYLTIYSFNQ